MNILKQLSGIGVFLVTLVSAMALTNGTTAGEEAIRILLAHFESEKRPPAPERSARRRSRRK